MTFSSLPFIFIFLPIVGLLFVVIRSNTYRTWLMLLASLFFYTWGEPVFVFFLLLLTLLNWFAGRQIEKKNKQQDGGGRGLTTFAIGLNLLCMLALKILTTSQLNWPFISAFREIHPKFSYPLGLSFIVFMAISYLVDINRGTVQAEANLIHFTNYLTFFPKVLQGPITPFADIKDAMHAWRTDWDDVAQGMRRFIIGLAKKVILADNLTYMIDNVFNADIGDLSTAAAWIGLLVFSIQIYLDFSGYSDMAIGLGRIFGVELPENFDFPYLSRSIAEFWRRWHMSLIKFFRVYVFMPLEISRRRVKHFRQQTNLIIIFLLTGLWHGITWNFILWGLYFGLILGLEAGPFSKWLKKIPVFFQHLYTLALVLLGWIFFKISNIADWLPFIKSLLGLNQASGICTLRTMGILPAIPWILISMLACTRFFNKIYKKCHENPVTSVLMDILLIGLLILCVAETLTRGYQAFLYSEF